MVILILLLAGCSGAQAGPSETGATGSQSVAQAIELPRWAVRDFWIYSVSDDPVTYVVTAEQGGDWIMETDSPERAFQDLRDDISRLGPQRKSDLAGSQGSDRVEFFRWPLTDGKTWATRWDGQPVTITAKLEAGVARLEAKDRNGTVAYQYTYDPAVRWFGELRHFAPDGSELVALSLAASGSLWKGEVARWSVEEVANQRGDLESEPPSSAVNFDVPLTATDVWANLRVDCQAGFVLGGVAPMPIVGTIAGTEPRGASVGGGTCPNAFAFVGSAGAPKAPPQGGTSEMWAWSLFATPGGGGTYVFEILVRTLSMVPVG